MKAGKVSRILAMALSTAALAVYGCGGGGGGGGGGGTTTTISSAPQAADAGASSVQSGSVSSNVGQSLSNIAAVGTGAGASKYRSPLVGKDTKFNKMHAAEVKAMKVPAKKKAAFLRKAQTAGKKAPVSFPGTTEPCTDGGTVAITGSYDDTTFAYNMIMTFLNCREDGEQYNGAITSTGTFSVTSDSFSMTMGDGDGVIESASDFRVEEFTDSTYTNLFATYIADMTVSGSGSLGATADTYSFTFTANGKEQYSDFIDTFNMTFTSLQFTSTTSYSSATATWSGSDTANGGFSETWTESSVTQGASITFTSFVTAWNSTSTYYDYSIDGTVVMDFTPDDLCFEGTFVIDTTTPVRYDFAAGYTTEGRVVINTNTAIVFNADGTVTVYLNDQPVIGSTDVPLETLEDACPIEDFEEDTSSETTFGNSTSIGGTTTGTSLLATLSWTGGETSDMDLHLVHYTQASPISSDTPDWHIYYAAQTSGGYGTLDYDDVDGYGPEHITMTSLPAGYYVLYVNNYNLETDPSATVTVALNIGDGVYTFPSYTFSSNDGSNYRVVDFTSDGSGTVTLSTPNTSLPYVAKFRPAAKAKR